MPRRPLTLLRSATTDCPHRSSRDVIKQFHDDPAGDVALQEYQKASLRCGSRFDCAKWLVDALHQAGRLPTKEPIRLLDVGALRLSYQKYERHRLQVDYINLQPPPGQLALCIRQQDYLQADFRDIYDVICFSLVLNFVPEPLLRGQMLSKAAKEVKDGGFVYIVLPKALLTNGGHINEVILRDRLGLLQLRLLQSHFSPKLYYALFQKDPSIRPFSPPTRKGPVGKIDFDIQIMSSRAELEEKREV